MRKDKIRDEILACGRDPTYFISKYVKIRHPTRGLIPFTMFDYQEDLVADYMRNRFNVILKARQLGISEITAAFAAWLMLFHRQKNILVMATKGNTAKNIVKKIRLALKHIPKWLMLSEITTDNVMSIELDNGSTVKAITTSEDAGRSEALSLLIIDEAAFIPGLEDLWTGLFPTVSAGGRVIVLSTPNGVGNKFHQIYSEAEKQDNDFKHTKLMWWEHPERVSDLMDDPERPGFKTSAWYRAEIKATNMSARDVAQELECNFNASGDTIISPEGLKWIEDGCLDPIEKTGWDRNVHIWTHPVAGRKYFISADCARGDGKDNSACIVFDVDTLQEHAEYYGKSKPEDFAKILVDLGKAYNAALLVVENNNIGMAVLEHIRIAMYENVYCSRKGDSKPGEAVNLYWGVPADDLVLGFTTSQRTRPLIIAKLDEYIRIQSCVFRSRRVHNELKTFIWNNGRPEAMKGCNDDLVMAASIGVWIRDTFLAPYAAASDVAQAMLSGFSLQTTQNTEITGASKDPRYARRADMGTGRSLVPQTNIRLPNGDMADFSWLLPISKG